MPKTRQILPKTVKNETTTAGNVGNSAPKPKYTLASTINSGAVSVYRVLTPVSNTTEAQPNTFLETTVTQPQNNTPQGEYQKSPKKCNLYIH